MNMCTLQTVCIENVVIDCVIAKLVLIQLIHMNTNGWKSPLAGIGRCLDVRADVFQLWLLHDISAQQWVSVSTVCLARRQLALFL